MPEQKKPGKYPEILEELRAFLAVHLREVEQDLDCDRLALVVTEWIRTYWWGTQVYIPKGRGIDVSIRDAAIEAQFTGTVNNMRDLRRRYQVSDRHLYRIVNDVRAARRKKLIEDRSLTVEPLKTGGSNV